MARNAPEQLKNLFMAFSFVQGVELHDYRMLQNLSYTYRKQDIEDKFALAAINHSFRLLLV